MKIDPSLIQQEDARSPAAGGGRREILERAKARSRANGTKGERPGALEGVPRFDQIRSDPRMVAAPGAGSAPPSTISRGTADALAAVAAANQSPPSDVGEPVQVDSPELLGLGDIVEILGCDQRAAKKISEILYQDRDPSGYAAHRKAVERRVGPLDLGEFLMNGVASQAVQIIPASDTHKGLQIVYSTVVDGVEAHVDALMGDEAARIRHVRLHEGGDKVIDANMTEREFVRRQNELAVAVHVRSYMGQAWPAITDAQGNVNADAVRTRVAKVRQIPSPLFVMVVNNLGWFLERVQETLDVAVLGNG